MRRLRCRKGDDRGASLVEMAFTLPLLLLLLFGIIEASWAFSQQNNIRHGSREGARIAAVDFGSVAAIGQEVCDRMDVIAATQSPTGVLTPIGTDSDIGGQAEISVSANLRTITGFLDPIFV
jgi:Flp pilus assembly protein TadG